MYPNLCGLFRKLPILMTIPRVNGAHGVLPGKTSEYLTAACENLHQLLRRNYFKLCVRAFTWFFIGAPPSKLRHVTEAGALHVLIGDLDYKFGA